MRFPREHPSYRRDEIDVLRITDFARLDKSGDIYVDYTGAGLYPESVLMTHLWTLRDAVAGNPHSDSPASLRASAWVDDARGTILRRFNANPDHYTVVFTANATAAMQLVGGAYPFDDFLFTQDAHNSLLGLREYARTLQAAVRYLPLNDQLRIPTDELMSRLALPTGAHRLFGYPAQCNFSGVQHPLAWIGAAQELGWRVLLDAAAFVPTNRLDLARHPADYVAVSFYKMFGWPTGVGALIATHEALEELSPPVHSGGSTQAASVTADWYRQAPGAAGFEHGTLNYLMLPGVIGGLEFLERVGVDAIHDRVQCLTSWTLHELTTLRHRNGAPMIRLYGPAGMTHRGATLTFNFLGPTGAVVDERIVSARAAAAGISLRTGCFCAPGAGEVAFGLAPGALEAARDLTEASIDDYLTTLGMPTGGAVRISYGLASTADDAERIIGWARSFAGEVPHSGELPARMHC